MSDSLRESFLQGSRDAGEKAKTDFDELRNSLDRITDAWRNKQHQATKAELGAKKLDDNRAPWRKQLGIGLESTLTHVFIVSLLVIDLIATAVDILKTIHIKTKDLNSCVALIEGCHCVGEFEGSESWEFIYWISICILIVLALNVLLLMVACGVDFFRHPGYVLDLVVVVTALALEIFLDSETVGLLIILSVWRIVRVAHGIFEVTDEAWEKEIKQFEEKLKELESEHDSDQELLRAKDGRITELEVAVARLRI